MLPPSSSSSSVAAEGRPERRKLPRGADARRAGCCVCVTCAGASPLSAWSRPRWRRTQGRTGSPTAAAAGQRRTVRGGNSSSRVEKAAAVRETHGAVPTPPLQLWRHSRSHFSCCCSGHSRRRVTSGHRHAPGPSRARQRRRHRPTARWPGPRQHQLRVSVARGERGDGVGGALGRCSSHSVSPAPARLLPRRQGTQRQDRLDDRHGRLGQEAEHERPHRSTVTHTPGPKFPLLRTHDRASFTASQGPLRLVFSSSCGRSVA